METSNDDANSMAIDASGNFYFAGSKWSQGRRWSDVRVFNPLGAHITTLEIDFDQPEIAVDANGLIYLTDLLGDRVAVYQMQSSATSTQGVATFRPDKRSRRRSKPKADS